MSFGNLLSPVVCALAALAVGCSTAHVRDPLTKTFAGDTPEVQGEFWYQLARRPVASNDEAFHALLLYMDGKDACGNYPARIKELKSRQMLPAGFAGAEDDAADRGTLAVALDRMLHIQGGLTMHLLGPTPRYALRAAVDRGIFPPSSPNQAISGGEFVGVMQKAEEFEHGNPADNPVDRQPVPASTEPIAIDDALRLLRMVQDSVNDPVYLDDLAATAPATQPSHLKAIVTGIHGDLVQIRDGPAADWKRARPGSLLYEGTEIRTGPKSSIRFLIPSDEAFCLDSEGSMTLAQAVVDLKKARTRMDLDRGRLREDLSHNTPVQIEEAGLEHDTVIKSPNSALALRGTKVSLFEQPSFEPIAVSLSGQATFTNTDGLRIPFGGSRHVVIVGNQTGAVYQADARATAITSGNVARLEFETREQAIVTQRGGFQRGDVLVGNLSINDFYTGPGHQLKLAGGLDFVLQWTGGSQQELNSLNLTVFSPNDPTNNATHTGPRDYVADPPFTYALNPNSLATKAIEASTYHQTSPSGGQISPDSVASNGLEVAFWPKNYPTGNYSFRVYDLVDAVYHNSPLYGTSPVSFSVTVYVNNKELPMYYSGTLGLLQTTITVPYNIPVPTSASVSRGGQGRGASVRSVRTISNTSKR